MSGSGHTDILAQEDSLRTSFTGSLVLHLGMAALAAGVTLLQDDPFRLGDPNAQGGGSVVVTPVASINMPSNSQRLQPVANDTRSQIEERVEDTKPAPIDPDAIGLGKKKKEDKKKKKESTALSDYLDTLKKRREEMDKSNIGSSTGARASSAIFQQQPGAGGVGTPSGLLGDGFGAYEMYLRTCIARNWKTTDVEMSLRTAPDVIVQFQIQRDGAGRASRVVQSSGNPRLDNSGLRAVEGCNPFNPLPVGFPKSTANIEIVFRLQR